MLLLITATGPKASDLSYLLQKHPDRLNERDLGFGKSLVFYPEASENRYVAALAVSVDPIGLVRESRIDLGGDGYVNDRPYVAGSLLSVAISRTFGSALAGRSKERPESVDAKIPLEARLVAVRASGGEAAIRRCFEPLGYEVECDFAPSIAWLADIGASAAAATVVIRGVAVVRDLLRHIYVLAPVIDNAKHYFIGLAEVDKLIRHGEGWLKDHPERDWIVERYLRFRSSLTRRALATFVADDSATDIEGDEAEIELEKPVRLHDERIATVLAALRDPAAGIKSVLDLGCGEGKLLCELAKVPHFERIVGVDVSPTALDRARDRIDRRRMPESRRKAISLIQGSLVYRDERLKGFDAAALVEVIEHVDPTRLKALEDCVFNTAAPGRVVVTTPNYEYNIKWPNLSSGEFRHGDHRFEWTRRQFAEWAEGVANRNGYRVRLSGIGVDDPEVGPPTQTALFTRLN